jgi:cell division septum initiation protein DivIVA
MEEVDGFLDQIAAELDRLYEQVERLQQNQIDHGDEQAIARALVTAQRAAEQTTNEAKNQARSIVDEAGREAADIRAAAERHAREVDGDLDRRRRDLERAISDLEAFEGDYRDRLRSSVESMLKALDAAAPKGRVAPSPPPGLLLPLPLPEPDTQPSASAGG